MENVQERQPARGLAFEDAWALFQETGKQMQETDEYILKKGAMTEGC
ncbi:MAG: hypothetical protein LBL45_07980 [Treponema sp.]|jgi:hypothetical protein|nr:hypothetical protein [Treponema sp.]